MLQRLKDFFASIKGVFLYVIFPLVMLGWYIRHLLGLNAKLTQELEQEKFNEVSNDTKQKEEEIDSKANSAVSDFEHLRDAYEKLSKKPPTGPTGKA